jgi:glycosyltransferase involved in cell wall biosynthesis
MPRILTIGHSYVVGLNRRLPQEWAKAGWDVTVVAPRRYRGDLGWIEAKAEPQEQFRLVSVSVKNTWSRHLFSYGEELDQLLSEAWDVVHVWEEPFVWASRGLARQTRASNRMVWATFQNLPKRYPPPFSGVERAVLRRAQGWIAFGQTVRENLAERPGYREKPYAVIPPGVDLEKFHPQLEKAQGLRQRWGWTGGEPVVGYVGRWVPEKGLRFFREVLEQWEKPWRLVLVGGGPLEKECRAWARHYPGRVQCCTGVSHEEVPAYLQALDVLVLPSRTTPRWQEQFGRILIEAMACGVPVIGSNSGEIPQVIGSTGWVVDENDHEGWRKALEEAILPLGRTRGLSGLPRAQQEFSWPVVAQRHLDFFATL